MLARALASAVLWLGLVVSSLAAGPHAYVLDHADNWTRATGAAEQLKAAGFEVQPLPLDLSPRELKPGSLIFLASFSSEHPGYREYVKKHGPALEAYLKQGNVLVQMTQADQVESVPAILPKPLHAVRCDTDFNAISLRSPAHPLLAGLFPQQQTQLQLDNSRTVWESFAEQKGFEVLLSGEASGSSPALLEAPVGKGRIILAALAFDKDASSADKPGENQFQTQRDAFRTGFFRNLAKHVADVHAEKAPPVKVTMPAPDPAAFAEGSWTLAVLPDTQVYTMNFPGLYTLQTAWIAQNRDRLDIKHVLHLGDITNNNNDKQWTVARDAMSLLDGKVPYIMAPGNHDYGPNGSANTRDTLFNKYFSFDKHKTQPTFGGAMEEGKLDNTFSTFEAGGRKWIVIALEWAPRDEAVAWAEEVMQKHPDHTGILITHAYMNNNERRYDIEDKAHTQQWNPHEYKTPGTKNDGQQLWDKLVKKHNFAMTLNGHVLGDGTGYLESKNEAGHPVHQMLSNYQFRTLGGEAYLRLLEFLPDGKTVRVKTYSPLYDKYMREPDQNFTIEIAPLK